MSVRLKKNALRTDGQNKNISNSISNGRTKWNSKKRILSLNLQTEHVPNFARDEQKNLKKKTNEKLIAAFFHFNILKQMYESELYTLAKYTRKIRVCSIRCAYWNHSVHNETSHGILYILQHCQHNIWVFRNRRRNVQASLLHSFSWSLVTNANILCK